MVCGCSPRDAFQQQLRVLLVRHAQLCGSAVQRDVGAPAHSHGQQLEKCAALPNRKAFSCITHTQKKQLYTDFLPENITI